jgi:hypothetical protein
MSSIVGQNKNGQSAHLGTYSYSRLSESWEDIVDMQGMALNNR